MTAPHAAAPLELRLTAQRAASLRDLDARVSRRHGPRDGRPRPLVGGVEMLGSWGLGKIVPRDRPDIAALTPPAA